MIEDGTYKGHPALVQRISETHVTVIYSEGGQRNFRVVRISEVQFKTPKNHEQDNQQGSDQGKIG